MSDVRGFVPLFALRAHKIRLDPGTAQSPSQRCHGASNRTRSVGTKLGTAGHAWPGRVPSAPSLWGCLATLGPCAVTGWSGLPGNAGLAGGSWLRTFSLPQGFSGTGQAVSMALSFGNKSALALLREPEGPVSPPGCDFSPSPFPAPLAAAGQQPGVSQPGAASPVLPLRPCPLLPTAPAPPELLGSPEETPSHPDPTSPRMRPSSPPCAHQPVWVPPGISAPCNP